MALEIERKFLLANDSWRGAVVRSARMSQAYLGGERASVRVRIVGDQAFLNIKSREQGHTRQEFEYSIPLSDAEQIMAGLVLPGAIDKTRHYIEFQGNTWELDEFHGANQGLCVAEIELVAADQAFARPAWLGAEVTEQRRYYNNELSRRPFQQWSDEEKLGPC
ncbi:CYTH domain-containing protein [Pseudomarimonas arenosa]|uniref:CYTH domain-containing protein n=1 Tax=Pseudomarimonas arenosa TaxID=2774145 RepID=A0AAW3ZF71_9GAMM|nr:CYTH domain-containing protein [Pseudomarimonas arenosa]MBD8524820.1 CYTH domain-containing protein [Pseudomarimonas arenosa]